MEKAQSVTDVNKIRRAFPEILPIKEGVRGASSVDETGAPSGYLGIETFVKGQWRPYAKVDCGPGGVKSIEILTK